ncbi:MAG: ubiquinol-cytochrome c reductase iron-sulfur subunit [Gaiellaceae bacterium]
MDGRPGDDRPQLPPPSLWPVGFAVGIVCLLVGLIVSWPVAAVGAGIAIVFGFLWAREVATGRTPTVAPDVEGDGAAVGAAAVPAHEGEAAMPEPEPGERFPRNRFLEGATLGLGAVIGAIVTLPAAGFAILPGFLKQKAHKVDLGPLTDFEENKWKVVNFIRDPAQGEISRRTAFVRNNGLLDGTPSFTIISNRCAHVGCPVQPGGPVFEQQEKTIKTANGAVNITPVLPAAGFICPCHGGSYDQEGNRIAGPPVRGLDRYEFDIVDGRLVLGDLYSVAKVEGAGKNAKITSYELTGPGQHVDGPEAWLYPLQPPH